MWKKGEKIIFPTFLFFFLLQTNTNDAHMQNIIQILRKMNSMNPENLKILSKWENMLKQGENGVKGSEKP